MMRPNFFGHVKHWHGHSFKGISFDHIIVAVAERGNDGICALCLYTKPNSGKLYYKVENRAGMGEREVPEHKVLHFLDLQAKRFKDPEFLAFLKAFRAEYKQLLALAAYGGNVENEAQK